MSLYSGHLLLAYELGKQLHEIMGWPGPMTHRQYQVWQLWLRRQWNVPDRSDRYQIQTAVEVRELRHSFAKHPEAVDPEDLKLKFKWKRSEPSRTPSSQEERDRQSQLIVARALNIPEMSADILGQPVPTPLPREIRPVMIGHAEKQEKAKQRLEDAMSQADQYAEIRHQKMLAARNKGKKPKMDDYSTETD